MVGKTNNSNSMLESLLAKASPEAQVAMVAADDAQKSRKSASLSRRQAQLDKLNHMRESAKKLREMADQTLSAGIWSGAIGIASAAASITGTAASHAAKAPKEGFATAAEATKAAKMATLARWSGYAGKSLKPLESFNPFNIAKEHTNYEKSKIDIEVEAAGHRESRAADSLAEAKRIQSGVMRTLSQIEDTKHRATIEATKV
jgi:hypothetical protein